MATYTLKADGTGDIGGGGITKFSPAVIQLSAGDTLQVFPGTYFETGNATFAGKDNCIIELPDAGEVVFDYDAVVAANLIQVVDVDTIFTGNINAILKIINFSGTFHGVFFVQHTASNPKLTIKNILTLIHGGVAGGASGFRAFGTGGTITFDIERVIVNRVYSSIWSDSGAAGVLFNADSCMFLEGQNGCNLTSIGTYNLTNCLVSGAFSQMIDANDATTTVNLKNTVVMPGADSAVVRMTNGTLNAINSRIHYRYTGQSAASGVTDGGNYESDDGIAPSKWSNWKRGGMVALCVDDTANYNAFQALKTEADIRGMKACLAIDFTGSGVSGEPSDAQWAQLKSDAENGHDLVVHTRHATNLSTLNAFGIQYTGDASTATMSIANGILTTTLAGDQTDGSVNLSLTLSDYTNASFLAAAVLALTGYDAVTFTSNGTTKVPVGSGITFGATTADRGYTNNSPLNTLADATNEDIKTAVYVAQQDQTPYFTEEIGGCIQDIFDNTGYTSTTLVYTSHFNTDAFQTAIESQGIGLAREKRIETQLWGSGNASFNNNFGYPVMATPSFVCDSELNGNTEADIKAKGAALAHYCNLTGSCIIAYGHSVTTQQDWAHFIDGIIDAGGVIGTITEIKDYIRTGTRVVDTDVVYYQHDHEQQDIDLAAALLVDDSYADRASGSLPASDGRTSAGIDGNPMSNSENSIGPVQSSNTSNHPSKV